MVRKLCQVANGTDDAANRGGKSVLAGEPSSELLSS